MNQDLAHFSRHRAVGEVANELGAPVARIIDDFVRPGIVRAAAASYAEVINNLRRFVTVGQPGPSRLVPGRIDGPPVLIAPEGSSFDAAGFYPDTDSAKAACIGEVVSVSDQRIARMTMDGLNALGADVGRHLGLAVEESISDALEAAVYPAEQTEGTSLNVANLAAALVKYEALRTTRGGYPPPARNLIVGPALASQIGALWPGGTGLDITVLTTMAPGRWYVTPSVSAGILSLDASDSVAVRESPDAVAAVHLVFHALIGESVNILTTAAGLPRFVLRGGI